MPRTRSAASKSSKSEVTPPLPPFRKKTKGKSTMASSSSPRTGDHTASQFTFADDHFKTQYPPPDFRQPPTRQKLHDAFGQLTSHLERIEEKQDDFKNLIEDMRLEMTIKLGGISSHHSSPPPKR